MKANAEKQVTQQLDTFFSKVPFDQLDSVTAEIKSNKNLSFIRHFIDQKMPSPDRLTPAQLEDAVKIEVPYARDQTVGQMVDEEAFTARSSTESQQVALAVDATESMSTKLGRMEANMLESINKSQPASNNARNESGMRM